MYPPEVPELLAPAGSLDAAYYGLQAGADAVYFGLQAFSARAAARNFSIEEARRLRAYSRRLGRRIYAAVNTLILPVEQQKLSETARFLDYLEVDAVILQDPAAIDIFRTVAPHIPLHGSTQMAVHDAPGVRWAQQLGLSRVVLAREMTAGETADLRAETAGILELEVFIHGAQCWAFSGLCLASGRLLGRSANRGRCAQICRSRFGEEHPFSADDKALGEEVLGAAAMGVHCLKIEGRMKSPAYAAAAVSWYRDILDHAADDHAADSGRHRDHLRTVFARNWSSGFWSGDSAGVNRRYPGATGIPAGSADEVRGRHFRITAVHELHVRDGILLETESGYVQTGVNSVATRRPGPSGTPPSRGRPEQKSLQTRLAAGQTGWIGVSVNPPCAGSEVRIISRHNSELPAAPAASLPLWRPEVELAITLLPGGMRVSCRWYSEIIDVPWEAARSPGKLSGQITKVFGSTSDWFVYSARVEGEDPGWFYPASGLKQLRRDWVSRAERAYWSQSFSFLRQEGVMPGYPPPFELPRDSRSQSGLPARRSLQRNGVPFLFPGDPLEPWIPAAGPVVLPLFPVSSGLPDWRDLAAYLAREDRPWVVLGLGNPSAVEQYRQEWSRYPRTAAFLDYGLYTLTQRARGIYVQHIPRLAAAAPWLEGESYESDSYTRAMEYSGFSPPLFISRNCYRRGSRGGCSGCDPLQPQHFELKQSRKRFRVTVYRCWSMLFASGG